MNDDERSALTDWAARLAEALQLTELDLDIDQVLELAGDAARAIVRPAAPVTTFLAGFAAGRAAATGTAPGAAVSAAVATATRLTAAE